MSSTAVIANMMDWESWDEWGRLPDNDQRGRLDNFFIKLANNPHHMGLFYIYAEKRIFLEK
jgi:hypothetical protein